MADDQRRRVEKQRIACCCLSSLLKKVQRRMSVFSQPQSTAEIVADREIVTPGIVVDSSGPSTDETEEHREVEETQIDKAKEEQTQKQECGRDVEEVKTLKGNCCQSDDSVFLVGRKLPGV